MLTQTPYIILSVKLSRQFEVFVVSPSIEATTVVIFFLIIGLSLFVTHLNFQ